MRKRMSSFIAMAAVSACAVGASANVFDMGGTRNADGTWTGLASLETVTVGNPGNIGERSGFWAGGAGPDRICGAVDYTYNIGKYEVTVGQYTEFLNAVAGVDMYGLYDPHMWSNPWACKIERYAGNGTPGDPYQYRVANDDTDGYWANRPVNGVGYWSACRFANWLHNGQPSGTQGPGTTETGAYTLNGYNGVDGREIQRNSDWKWALTSENEWYKAAYHKNDGATGNYYDYPTSSDAIPSNDWFDTDPGNSATYFASFWPHDGDDFTIGAPYYRTEVGAHENSASPYGTFDQGGNVWEWNESVTYVPVDYVFRGVRGGACIESSYGDMHASLSGCSGYPAGGGSGFGFRVVQLPEPTSLALLALTGAAVLVRRRRPRM